MPNLCIRRLDFVNTSNRPLLACNQGLYAEFDRLLDNVSSWRIGLQAKNAPEGFREPRTCVDQAGFRWTEIRTGRNPDAGWAGNGWLGATMRSAIRRAQRICAGRGGARQCAFSAAGRILRDHRSRARGKAVPTLRPMAVRETGSFSALNSLAKSEM